jgi:hypothetical protein
VQRLRPFESAALPHAACLLLAACLALPGGLARAQAQTALVNSDPFAPTLETNAKTPPRFQKLDDSQQTGLVEPSTLTQVFAPVPSGAGTTGFDATNAPDRPLNPPRLRTSTTVNGQTAALNTADQAPQLGATPARPPELGAAVQAPTTLPSSYSQPQILPAQPSEEGNNALAQATPGTPPVPEVGPIRKLPPKPKAHVLPQDPYAPLGIRAGAFDLYPAVDVLGGYDTNPSQASQNGKGAWLLSVQPELRVQSDWSRHELKANLRGSYNAYSPEQTPKLSRPYFNGTVDGRIDVSHLTRINLQARGLLSTDNPSSPNVQAGLSELPIFTTLGGSAGVAHRFNRLELSIKGDADRTVYQQSHFTDGTTASNEDRNYDQYGGKLRAGYELLPGVVPFAEFSADTRKHDLKMDAFGYERDSDGITGTAGTSFNLRGTLTGEAALGYTDRHYEDPRLMPVQGLVGNASLVWTASALTTAKLTGAATVGESTIPGVSGALYRDIGLQVDHAFRWWLVGTAKVGYGNDNYVGLSRDDNRYSAGVGLTYKFNRSLQLKGEIDQYWLRSNQPGNNYSETLFLMGLRLQR